jgi:tetratricopeptide (TPR) repeat protein
MKEDGNSGGVSDVLARWIPVMVIVFLTLSSFQPVKHRDPIFTPEGSIVSKTAALLNDQGVELYRTGKLEEALGSFILASEADPTFAIAHYNCAVVLTTRGFRGDLEEAVRHLERSYYLDPGNTEIQEFLLELMERAYLTA